MKESYNSVEFAVIEFCDNEDSEEQTIKSIIAKENAFKKILGTINYGPYNGLQLNNN